MLASIGEARRTMIEVQDRLRSSDDITRATDNLLRAIDEYAGALTGDREHFWSSEHRSSDSRPAKSREVSRRSGLIDGRYLVRCPLPSDATSSANSQGCILNFRPPRLT
jgi:hypothetical protein